MVNAVEYFSRITTEHPNFTRKIKQTVG